MYRDFTISVCDKELSELKTKLVSAKFPIEKHFNLVHFSCIESGGHFTAMENPNAYCENFVQFAQLLLKI
jgi:hypothetical protein